MNPFCLLIAWLFASEIMDSISEGRSQNSETPTSGSVNDEDDEGVLSKLKRKIFGWWRCSSRILIYCYQFEVSHSCQNFKCLMSCHSCYFHHEWND